MSINFEAEFLKYNGFSVFAVHTVKSDGSCSCDKKDCSYIGKHPATIHGFKDACNNLENTYGGGILADSNLNIGIATGGHFFVLDVDKKNGGLDALADLEKKHGKLPKTIEVDTGGGGKHFYFKKDSNFKIKCFQNSATGLEIKAEGGYVVCPPSVHASGKTYEWIVPPYEEMAEAPKWLLDYIDNNSKDKKKPARGQDQPRQSSPALDLKSHNGSDEGNRNNTLCQLIGREFGKKTTPDEILQDAYDWGNRCNPPMDKSEIEKTFNSIFKREQTNLASSPLIFKPVLHEDAYYGIAGEIVKKIEPETEGHPFGLLITLLIYVGNQHGRKSYFLIESTKHYPNLFTVLVGKSAKSRKGTTVDRIINLFSCANNLHTNLTTGLSSGEGIKFAVRDPITETKTDPKDPAAPPKTIIKDNGVGDKRLLIIESEFANVLKVIKRDGNILDAVLRDAFDGKNLQTITKNSPTKATDPHISIIGSITSDELLSLMDKASMHNGFANRFLFGFVERTKILPHGGNQIDLSLHINSLSKKIQGIHGQMVFTPEAYDYWKEIYPILTEDQSGLIGSLSSRAEAHTLRISMIYAIMDGTLNIKLEHLKAGYAVVNYSLESLKIIFQQKANNTSVGPRILSIINSNDGIKQSEILKSLGGHTTAEVVQNALHHLESEQLVFRKIESSNGGRNAIVWYPK